MVLTLIFWSFIRTVCCSYLFPFSVCSLLINNLSLDSGILCCLIHILNALLDSDEANEKQKVTDRDEQFKSEEDYDGDAGQVRRLEVAFT